MLMVASTSKGQFSRADTLRGLLSKERSCFDVTFYDLTVKIDPATKRIAGSNSIVFKATESFKRIQIDLFKEIEILGITYDDIPLKFNREYNAVWIDFPTEIKKNQTGEILVRFQGKPIIAKNAPWDGGLIWTKDKNGKTWAGVACEGIGASLWWPLKDHLSDEPDSMAINIIAPSDLVAVANGQLRGEKAVEPGWKRWEWFVSYPINSYNVTFNLGDYAHIHDTYQNESGTHDLDYYVLKHNEAKARKHFQQVKPMMECFEKHFGEYPFWNDGYALVETPYLGMEHQGAIAYGNRYMRGYLGSNPLNLEFDYIVVHESGHEWWGNSVSCRDHAELWIHESFCTYSEAIYVECMHGKDTAEKYLAAQAFNIANLDPIVGPLDVNYQNWRGSDMYYKGSWLLHTIRKTTDDDEKWFAAIKEFAETYKYGILSTDEVIDWFNQKLGNDLTWLWKQYLYYPKPPQFEYKTNKKGKKTKIRYRWVADEETFRLPLKIKSNAGKEIKINPTTTWQKAKLEVPVSEFEIIPHQFYGKTVDLREQ